MMIDRQNDIRLLQGYLGLHIRGIRYQLINMYVYNIHIYIFSIVFF